MVPVPLPSTKMALPSVRSALAVRVILPSVVLIEWLTSSCEPSPPARKVKSPLPRFFTPEPAASMVKLPPAVLTLMLPVPSALLCSACSTLSTPPLAVSPMTKSLLVALTALTLSNSVANRLMPVVALTVRFRPCSGSLVWLSVALSSCLTAPLAEYRFTSYQVAPS